MTPIPRISSERLATLPAGTRLKFVDQVITFNRCNNGQVSYTQTDGTIREISDFVISNAATEHLSAVRCECCGVFLQPDDVKRTVIQRYRKSEVLLACADGLCTRIYQSRQQTPQRRAIQKKVWRSAW